MGNISRKSLLFSAMGVLVAGVAVSAFAANLVTSSSNSGQGVGVVEGYHADGFIYRTGADETNSDASGMLTEIEFTLWKNEDNQEVSSVTAGGTEVFVQVRVNPPGTSGDWSQCQVFTEPVPGTIICSLEGEEQRLIDDMIGIGIVAFDVNGGDE